MANINVLGKAQSTPDSINELYLAVKKSFNRIEFLRALPYGTEPSNKGIMEKTCAWLMGKLSITITEQQNRNKN